MQLDVYPSRIRRPNQVILLHESGAVTEGYLIFRNPFLPSYQIVLYKDR
ncbi:MAG TPA: hypothetical protein VLA74_04870 [Nitrososphaeraceae archaeon]|nr:hypothetical protein [Nitrososphaeraceae archaeon]